MHTSRYPVPGAARYILLVFLMVLIGGISAPCLGGEDDTADEGTVSVQSRFELDEIVVTASKVEEPVAKIPRNVTVITAEDIAEAPSNNIIDLLGREVGLNVRSLQGTDRQAVIDIRGMGATAGSNVVVLVDGVKMNSPDLSGPDLSSISLDQIERIEIIRGSGGVLYGDGAVGGVVNIVTKKGTLRTEVKASASYGSYNTFDTWASVRGGHKDLSYSLNGAYHDSDGYRENGGLKRGDVAGALDYHLGDSVTFNLAGSHHVDEYGMPGPVSIDVVDSESDRVKSHSPDDGGETEDNRVSLGLEFESESLGYLKMVRGYRSRENSFIIGYSPIIEKEDQISTIDESGKTFLLTYDKSYALFSRKHSLMLGVDHYFIDYIREELPTGPRKNSRTDNLGFFVNNRWSLTEDLLFQLGYRGNRYEGRYRTDKLLEFPEGKRWVNGEEETTDWYNDAWDLGLTYSPSKEVNLFASYATSFRIPNVDELAVAEDDLTPQKGYHLDAGGRFRFMEKLEFTITLFNLVIEDEIYYSDVNKNYDDSTVRRGIEANVKYHLAQSFFVWGNYTYTDARFADKDTVVPLVPQNMGSAGLEWRIVDPLSLSLTGTYVGSRYDGNENESVLTHYSKLDPYQVFDTRATYLYGKFKLFAGMNNMFDEMYSTVAYSEAYYPMPGRNVYAGVAWSL
ncbi:MAG: TonB-dependent receptor [Deltaproteobacteria bacterium]|nr:TonB-dependent receptor [Deltaproteobacteria bacterium]MBW2678440.1 TonB-dependent receptor [Deltaproteobacteria bacterium]